MSQSSPEKKLVLLILITLGFWSAVIFSVYHFIARDLKRLSAEIGEKRLKIAQLDYNAHNFESFAQDYQEVSKDIKDIEGVLLEEKEIIVFIQKLEKIAEENGLEQSISLKRQEEKEEKDEEEKEGKEKTEKKEPKKEELRPLLYRVDLGGDFPQIVRYIQALENLNNYTNINSLVLSLEQGKEKEKNIVRAIIEAEVYMK